MASAHAKRWATALVAIPILVLLIGKGGRVPFAVLVTVATTVGLLEYYRMALSPQAAAVKVVGVLFGLTLVASFFTGGLRVVPILMAAAFFGFATICLANFGRETSMPEVFCKQISGLIYIPFMLGHLILIRDWDQGATWTFFLMAVVFAGDTAAFYVGRAVGQRKLAPKISPGKTVEGAFGGLIASLLVGIVFKTYFFPAFGWGQWVFLVILLGALGQTGDLFESMLKRSVQVKDSGGIVPGHGGLLDRIDGLIFAAPGLYYFRTYFM